MNVPCAMLKLLLNSKTFCDLLALKKYINVTNCNKDNAMVHMESGAVLLYSWQRNAAERRNAIAAIHITLGPTASIIKLVPIRCLTCIL